MQPKNSPCRPTDLILTFLLLAGGKELIIVLPVYLLSLEAGLIYT